MLAEIDVDIEKLTTTSNGDKRWYLAMTVAVGNDNKKWQLDMAADHDNPWHVGTFEGFAMAFKYQKTACS